MQACGGRPHRPFSLDTRGHVDFMLGAVNQHHVEM
jgi:hypothetical protein